jgi:iron complex outermembrane receptor protein
MVQRYLLTTLSIACTLGTAAARADNPAEALELPTVVIIATTPLPGLGVPIERVPGNVQVYTSEQLDAQHQGSLTDFMEQNAGNVSINSGQGNPFQPDILFRGFTASPLLGLAQGLSVFQDGIRINEPFGDVVNWDFVPESAIANLQIIPGSNPAFGLNTLGGAVALYTKSGSDYPGAALEYSGGAFGRQEGELEYGGKHGPFDYFLTGNYSDDRGWADHNPSRVKQFFGKVGYQTETTDVDLALTAADNTLQGTQTLPLSFFDNTHQAYTWPDLNRNKLTFVTLKGSQFLNDDVLLGGSLYYRKYTSGSVASNVNNNFGQIDPGSGTVDSVQATNDKSSIDQWSYGAGLQLTLRGALADRQNQFVLGASGNSGDARFTQFAQDAAFTADRGTTALNVFTLATDAKSVQRDYGVFFADTLALDTRWSLSVSGRYNRAEITIEDETGSAPRLNGSHTFSRFNPAVGITFNPSRQLTGYATYNEGMRAPTPIELTCADPDAPCKLPNNFLADPSLTEVTSKTFEVGVRGKAGDASSWSAAVYRTNLNNDIEFVSSTGAAVNAGFFQNVGQSRREGLELSAATKQGPLRISVNYSYTLATFESPFAESSPANSSADASGSIAVRSGDRIPGIPQHSLKLRIAYEIRENWSAAVSVNYANATFARGDENNQDVNGKVPGYTVVNFDSHYQATRAVQLFVRVNNLFDRQYANFGILSQNFFAGPNHTFDGGNAVNEQFRGVGVPRGAWLGIRVNLR